MSGREDEDSLDELLDRCIFNRFVWLRIEEEMEEDSIGKM